jgi:hypothetical protein
MGWEREGEIVGRGGGEDKERERMTSGPLAWLLG